MSCFTDIITVKDNCTDKTSKSGLLINDIGIGLEELNKINNSDYPSGELFFESKVDFAVKLVQHDISAQLAGKYKANSLVDGARLGFFNDNLKSVSGAVDSLRGLEIELCNTNSYLDVYISSISLLTDYTGDIEVKVIDLIQGIQIDTITVSSVAGEISEKLINKTYKSDRKKLNIIFVYDTTSINSYSTTITKNYCFTCNGGMSNINQYLKARGVSIPSLSTPIKTNTRSLADTAGISIVYSLQCNHTDWMCTMSNLMAMPILYKTGIEIAEHALGSSVRANTNTRELAGKWEKRLASYMIKYEETLGSILNNIKLPSDSKCFECDVRSKHVTILP